MLTFENFVTLKRPIVLLLNDFDTKNSEKIKQFFKGKPNLKIYDNDFNRDKVLNSNAKLVIDINESKLTRGIYVNSSKSVFEKTKKALLNNGNIPFIGKVQANKNKKFELELFKKGIPYVYIEFPSSHFDPKVILKTQLVLIKKLISI